MPDDANNLETPLPTDVRQGSTELLDLNAPGAEPVTDPMTGLPVREPTPATPEQEAASQATLSDPVKAIMEPGAADAAGPRHEQPTVPMEPGHADLYPNEQNQEMQVIRPGSAGGFVPHSKTIEGVAPGAAKELTAKQAGMEPLQREAGNANISASQKYADYVNAQAEKQYQENQAQDLANAAEQTRNSMVQARIQDKMKQAADFKPNRQQIFEGTAGGFRALGAVVGMLFGGALSGLTGQRNSAEDAVFKMIDDNVADQVRHNTGVYNELKDRLGDEQAAAVALRQKHLEFAKNIMDAQTLGRQGQAAIAALGGAKQRVELEIQNGQLQMMEKLAPHEKLALAHMAPNPTQLITLDRQEQMLKQHNVTPEMRKEFLLHKFDAHTTVGDTIGKIKQDSRDINMLEGLKKELGHLPGKDEVIDWTRTPMLRALGTRAGFTKATKASQVYQLQAKAVMERAASYGKISDREIESVEHQIGDNGDQLLDFMKETRNFAQDRLRGAAGAILGGGAQPALDIMVNGIDSTPGVRTAGVTARE